jgi:hypothetical protein
MTHNTLRLKHLGLACLTAGVMLGAYVSPTSADVVRTGPNGRQATTTRTYDSGTVIRTTTGSEGNSASTTRTYDDGAIYRTTTGPNGETYDSSSSYEYDEDGLTRTTTGPNGNSWSVIRTRQ